jgi:hypothetical protein
MMVLKSFWNDLSGDLHMNYVRKTNKTQAELTILEKLEKLTVA